MSAAKRCACSRSLARLIRQHADDSIKRLAPEEGIDESTLVSGSIRCPLCHTLYVVSTIVVAVPTPESEQAPPDATVR